MKEVVYIYDGSFEGMLCCVFEAYEKKEKPINIALENGLQLMLGQSTKKIDTNSEKAARVEAGFRKKAGEFALENIEIVYLSNFENKALICFRYICLGLRVGREITGMLANRYVLPVSNICFTVTREVQHMHGFLRFALMENNVFFAKITPRSSLVSLIMPHFVDRYSDQPFVIYDANHSLAGIYNLKTWEIVETGEVDLPEMAAGEAEWIKLWRRFYDRIGIKEKFNPKLQRQMCPKRFWDNMPELNETEYKDRAFLEDSAKLPLEKITAD